MAGAAALALAAGTAAQTAATQEAPDGSRVVLITGTSSGFGRLMVESFARAGWQVLATLREMDGRNAAAAAELLALAEAEGLALSVDEVDVDSEAPVAAGVASALARSGGRLNAVVNNAGIGIYAPVELVPTEAVRRQLETNVLGAHRVARATLPSLPPTPRVA